jgi:hypothetical protein
MSNPRATKLKSTPPVQSRSLQKWLIVAGVSLCGAIALAVAGRSLIEGTSETADAIPVPSNKSQSITDEQPKTKRPRSKPQSKKEPASKDSSLVSDDGKTLWVSPTHGPAVDLAYLSPGAQIIAVLRPAALLKHPEGEKVRAALGPAGQKEIERIEQLIGLRLDDVERLVVGAEATSSGKWLVTFVVHAGAPISRETLLAKLTGAVKKSQQGTDYWSSGERAYYMPTAGEGKVLVVAPAESIADIIDLAGSPPALRRDIERLLDHTDAERHATIIVAPNSLFSEGQSIFAGELGSLRSPLFWFLGDELSGAAISMNWSDNFFLELIGTPKLETTTPRAAQIFADRCAKIPEKLQQYVTHLGPQPYGREVIERFPAMVGKLAAYTRSGSEPDHAVLRCYLPIVAGHNLLMAAELTLAESAVGGTKLASDRTADSGEAITSAASLRGKLAKKTSLRFAKDTLEAALEQLSQDIGVPIVIRGPDLQAEGITKNQSFGIDISNKPAEEILVQILRLANPDKSATSPSDPHQKLVYIFEQKPDKSEQIVVTTRARAAERRNELPAAFRTAKP